VLFTRFPLHHLISHASGDDYTIRRLTLVKDEILLGVVHFPSKLHTTNEDRVLFTSAFSAKLAEAEEAAFHTRTVLVGDFNMNPYEDGLVAGHCLHGVMTREIACRPARKVKFRPNRYFYNPMWQHFGEKPEGHAGTYYFASPRQRADFWNIYDQVLVRGELLPYFRDEEVEIVSRDPDTGAPFLKGGFPDDAVSDHLPVLFRLNV
jgi:hypothetical protein